MTSYEISPELQKEFFELDVTFNGSLAKWQNHKHPDNSNFMQIVFWAAWESNNNLIVVYYLDSTNIGKNYHHAIIPMTKPFKDMVFDYWISN